MTPPPLILASASPRRRELLASLGVAFDVVPAPVDEHEAVDADPVELVRHNAALKAGWVAERHPAALVLGADTTVFVDGCVLNKPEDPNGARRMLQRLSGVTHTVYTGLAFRRTDAGWSEDFGVASRVTFRRLDEALIDRYLELARPFDKAGAYGIQDHGELIVDHWEGSFTNIVGLPLEETRQVLTRCGLLPPSR